MQRREFLFGAIALPFTASSQEISKYLESPPLHRPRLLTNAGKLNEVRLKLQNSQFGKKIQAQTIHRANIILEQGLVELQYEAHRHVLLPTSREVLKRTEMLGVAWLITGDKIYSDRLALEMENICQFETWNPEHFLDVAEMTAAAALAYDWCANTFSNPLREHLKNAIIEKGLKPGFEDYENNKFWTGVSHNWNIVCNAGMILGALSVADTDWQLARSILSKASVSIQRGLDSFGPDGAWREGVSYWDYATQYAVFYFATMAACFGEQTNSTMPAGFSNTAAFRLHMQGPSGQVFNYGDCPPRVRVSPQMLWMASQFEQQNFATLTLEMQAPLGSGLLWFDKQPTELEAAKFPTDAYFRGAEIVSFRNTWGKDSALWVAIKGGSNAENHGNLDIGTFVLESEGVRFACDLGPDDYSLPGYFSNSQRVNYPKIATAFQNTLFDGKNQTPTATARIVSYKSSESFSYGQIDMAEAYRSTIRIKRGCAMIKRSLILIKDEFQLGGDSTLQWQMLTQASVELDNNIATLRRNGKTLYALILERGLTFALEELHALVADEDDTVRKILIKIPPDTEAVSVAFFNRWPHPDLIDKMTNVTMDKWPMD